MSIRRAIFNTTVLLSAFLPLAGSIAQAQQGNNPCVIGPPSNPMVFYLARGPVGACGEGCSEWIAAEGVIQWDTYKRLIAILDRNPERRLPVVIHADSRSSFALGLGRILRERGLDTTAGQTEVSACVEKTSVECLALKRSGHPLEATVNFSDVQCDMGCVLMMLGGVHCHLPADAKVRLSDWTIRSRFCTNIPQEWREGLHGHFGEQVHRYLRQMGVDAALHDLVDEISRAKQAVELPPADWQRLKIVTAPSP